MPSESRYKIPSFERFVNRLISFIFYYRLPLVVILVGGLIYITVKVYYFSPEPNKFINASAILTGGSIIIGIFYSIINYEHTYYKGKSDSKLAQQVLSFNASFEWHKPTIVEHLKVTKKLYEEHKHLINEGKSTEFSAILDNDEIARFSLVSLFNFLECIAIGVQEGVMDEVFIKKYFNGIFRSYSNDYLFYINYRRKVNNTPNTWINFTSLAEDWVKQN